MTTGTPLTLDPDTVPVAVEALKDAARTRRAAAEVLALQADTGRAAGKDARSAAMRVVAVLAEARRLDAMADAIGALAGDQQPTTHPVATRAASTMGGQPDVPSDGDPDPVDDPADVPDVDGDALIADALDTPTAPAVDGVSHPVDMAQVAAQVVARHGGNTPLRAVPDDPGRA